MKYTIKIAGVKGDVIIERTFWGQARVALSGSTPSRLAEKGSPYALPASGGSTKKLVLKARYLDPCPAVFVDGQEVLIVRKLHILESVFAALPMGMFLGHGILAVFLGLLVIKFNFGILRTEIHATLKWALIYFASLSAYFFFCLLVKAIFH